MYVPDLAHLPCDAGRRLDWRAYLYKVARLIPGGLFWQILLEAQRKENNKDGHGLDVSDSLWKHGESD